VTAERFPSDEQCQAWIREAMFAAWKAEARNCAGFPLSDGEVVRMLELETFEWRKREAADPGAHA
jgi:hypothetical protein